MRPISRKNATTSVRFEVLRTKYSQLSLQNCQIPYFHGIFVEKRHVIAPREPLRKLTEDKSGEDFVCEKISRKTLPISIAKFGKNATSLWFVLRESHRKSSFFRQSSVRFGEDFKLQWSRRYPTQRWDRILEISSVQCRFSRRHWRIFELKETPFSKHCFREIFKDVALWFCFSFFRRFHGKFFRFQK